MNVLSELFTLIITHFDDLLKLDKSVTIHMKNLHFLATEIFKFLKGLSPKIMNSIFQVNTSSRLSHRNFRELYSRNPKTVKYGIETISYLAPKLWEMVPIDAKNSKSVSEFKSKIKLWKPNCHCRLCKTYV